MMRIFKFGGSNCMHIEPASIGSGGLDHLPSRSVCILCNCVSKGEGSDGRENFIYIEPVRAKLYIHWPFETKTPHTLSRF